MWSLNFPSSFVLNYEGEGHDDEFADITTNTVNSIAYKVVACVIFGVVSYTFLFPCNSLIPLDRRTVAVLGAVLCYCTRTFVFMDRQMNMLQAVDFDVLVLLASIMAINHLVVHLKETKHAIAFLQKQVQQNPLKGFWLVSAASLIVAPFLTNDGVCLLFVQLILDALEGVKAIEDQLATKSQNMITNTPEQRALIVKMKDMPLETGDAIYFLLTLACSANIGSALTYTGNPQNMIVAEDAAPVLPPIKFLGIMLLPTLASWLITTYWIQRCWLYSKGRVNHNGNFPVASSEPEHLAEEMNHDGTRNPLQSAAALCIPASALSPRASLNQSGKTPTTAGAGADAVSPRDSMSPIMSPRRRRAKDREAMVEQVTYFVSSPFPYMILILLAIMIIMIFVNVMPIAALTCISAIVMVVALVLGNHWRGMPIWGEDENPRKPLLNSDSDSTTMTQTQAANNSPMNAESAESRAERGMSTDAGASMLGNGESKGSDEIAAPPSGAHRRKVSYSLLGDDSSGPSTHRSHSRQSSNSNGSYVMIGEKKNSDEDAALLVDVKARSASSAGATTALIVRTDGTNNNNNAHSNQTTQYMPLTKEEKIENMNDFFEELFKSIDYSLLLIFLGTFIVVANVDSTGIPRAIWQSIVGKVPFNTASSVIGISLFVLISSQLLGNVAVVQLAKPNVEDLGEREKAYAWAVISFVATVGGNLTITGSAANIIVAEKASRIDPNSNIDFFRHYRVCFWVTLLCCALGALLITAEFQLDDLVNR